MSVTIVSALPKQAPASADTGTPAAADTDAGALDFASLLLGQAPIVVPLVVPETKALQDESKDAAPADATALLAMIGAVTPTPLAASDPTKDKTDAPAIAALGKAANATTLAAAPELPLAPGKAAPATTDAPQNELTATPTPTPVTAEKPAIIAASAETVSAIKTEFAQAAPATPAESAAGAAAAASANANVGAAHRETATSIATPVRDHAWAGDFAQKVVWLATSEKQSAQLTLNPAQMGPIEISMSVDKGHATASFFSANAEVRDAIETAMPRLREMFANAGISLGQTNVSAESFRQPAANDYRGGSRSTNDDAILTVGAGVALSGGTPGALRGNGLVDIFA